MSLARLSALLLCIIALQTSYSALAEDQPAPCNLKKVADLSVTVTSRNQVLVDGSIKGEPVKFQIDTGTMFSVFDSAVFSHFGVSTAGTQYRMVGAGGEMQGITTHIPDLKFGDFVSENLTWMISTTHFLPDGVYGLVGEDFLTSFDLDIDLANHKIGLYEYNSCPTEPVYWSPTFSEADLSIQPNRLFVGIEVNGTQAKARFDTGAGRSYISTRLVKRMGLDIDSAGMIKAGFTLGADLHRLDVYQYRFSELHVGDEVVKNPLLNIANLSPVKHAYDSATRLQDDNFSDSEGLLGADFIKTHHIYIATRGRKMYFTYNGGGIFSPPKEDSATTAAK